MLPLIPTHYKILAAALAAVFIWGLGYWKGRSAVQEKWDAAIAAAEKQRAEHQAKQAEVTTKVVTQYVTKREVIKEKADEIVREVPIFIRATDTCPAGIRVLHDAAALQADLPDPAGAADDRPAATEDAAARR